MNSGLTKYSSIATKAGRRSNMGRIAAWRARQRCPSSPTFESSSTTPHSTPTTTESLTFTKAQPHDSAGSRPRYHVAPWSGGGAVTCTRPTSRELTVEGMAVEVVELSRLARASLAKSALSRSLAHDCLTAGVNLDDSSLAIKVLDLFDLPHAGL